MIELTGVRARERFAATRRRRASTHVASVGRRSGVGRTAGKHGIARGTDLGTRSAPGAVTRRNRGWSATTTGLRRFREGCAVWKAGWGAGAGRYGRGERISGAAMSLVFTFVAPSGS